MVDHCCHLVGKHFRSLGKKASLPRTPIFRCACLRTRITWGTYKHVQAWVPAPQNQVDQKPQEVVETRLQPGLGFWKLLGIPKAHSELRTAACSQSLPPCLAHVLPQSHSPRSEYEPRLKRKKHTSERVKVF